MASGTRPGGASPCPEQWAEQELLERAAFLEGKRRLEAFLKRSRENSTEPFTPPGQWIVRRVIGPMAELLSVEIARSGSGRATPGGQMLYRVRDMDPAFLCGVATRAALAGAFTAHQGGKRSLTGVATDIGLAIEDEFRWHRWEVRDSHQAHIVRKIVDKRYSSRNKRITARKIAEHREVDLGARWTEPEQVAIGRRFVDYMTHPTIGLFEPTKMFTKRRGKAAQPAHALRLTPIVRQRANEVADLISTSRSLTWPLIVPPKPWTAPFGGGFWFREEVAEGILPEGLRPFPLVRHAGPEQRKALEESDKVGTLATVYGALNALQSTPWRINKRVLDVWTAMVDGGFGPTGDVAEWDNEELPELADADTWEEMTDADRRAHKRERQGVHERNREAIRARTRQHRLKQIVERLAPNKVAEFYFAYNCDRRGRVYAASPELSPQGSRIEKGLLEFANGDTLADRGVFWLKVAVANYYGHDKVSFEDRARWTEDHEDLVLSTAAHPLDDERWWKAGAKTRWQFLAACFAYQEWRQATTEGRPYVCRLPVMLDGTCNGLQHWAALMRDEHVGAYVNLVPGDAPRDLYGNVAETAHRIIDEMIERRVQWALECRALKIDRNFTKPVVMNFPYGQTLYTAREKIWDVTGEEIEKRGSLPSWWEDSAARQSVNAVLSKAIWDATMEEVKLPEQGREYLKQIVQRWKKAQPEKPIAWTSPSGFPVVLVKRGQGPDEARVRERLRGEWVRSTLWLGKGPLDWAKITSAISPSFVHSCDAAHLHRAVTQASENGVRSIACVHDSFGATPERIEGLAEVLRSTFVEVHKSDPLEVLEGALGMKAGPRPTSGRLDLEAVIQSRYLFG